MAHAATGAILHGTTQAEFCPVLTDIANRSFIKQEEVREILVMAWSHVLDRFLDDEFLSPEEEGKLGTSKVSFRLIVRNWTDTAHTQNCHVLSSYET